MQGPEAQVRAQPRGTRCGEEVAAIGIAIKRFCNELIELLERRSFSGRGQGGRRTIGEIAEQGWSR